MLWFGALQLTCVYVALCWCVILSLWGHLQCLRNLLLCTSLCVCFLGLCVSACVFLVKTRSEIAAQPGSLFRQSGRGVRQIKHKPANHRRRLISAVLKGEPGMSDESLLWISQWCTTVCLHERSLVTEKRDREGKVQREPPVIWHCCNLIIWEHRGVGGMALNILYQHFTYVHGKQPQTQTVSQPHTHSPQNFI